MMVGYWGCHSRQHWTFGMWFEITDNQNIITSQWLSLLHMQLHHNVHECSNVLCNAYLMSDMRLVWICSIPSVQEDVSYQPLVPAKVYSDGNVSWHYPTILKSTCHLKVDYFPWDQQSCELNFFSWTHDGTEVGGELRSSPVLKTALSWSTRLLFLVYMGTSWVLKLSAKVHCAWVLIFLHDSPLIEMHFL